VPNELQPHLDFQRDFGFPQVFERSINARPGKVFVDIFDSKLTIFGPVPHRQIIPLSQHNSAQFVPHFTILNQEFSREPSPISKEPISTSSSSYSNVNLIAQVVK
jgi:hypothetical protein